MLGRFPIAILAVIGPLWLLTLAASDAPGGVISLFWAAVGLVLAGWALWDAHRSTSRVVAAVSDVLERDRAAVLEVRSDTVLEVEESDDEGACWLFALADGEYLVLAGQAYYPTPRFPSTEFSLISPLRSDGRRFDVWLKCGGHRLAPRRCLPAALRISLPDAEHGAVLSPEDATRVLAVGDANAAA